MEKPGQSGLKYRQSRFKETMKKAVVAAALAFSTYFMSGDVQAVPKKAKGPECSAELVQPEVCNKDYDYSDKKKNGFCVITKDKKALQVMFDAKFVDKIYKLQAEKISLVFQVNGDQAADAAIGGEKKTWICLDEKQAVGYEGRKKERDAMMGTTDTSSQASEPSIGPMDSKDNAALRKQVGDSLKNLSDTLGKKGGSGDTALSRMRLRLANISLGVYDSEMKKPAASRLSSNELRKKLKDAASEVKKAYDLLEKGKERVIPADEGSERMITSSAPDTRAEDPALKAARENAEKILKAKKPSDAVLERARAELLKMEASLLASIESVCSTHQFMPAYKPWRKAHDMLAEESQTKKGLEEAKLNLDNAGTALKGLKKQADTYGNDAIKAKAFIDGEQRNRSAQKNAAALKSEMARVKRFIEKAKLSEEQRKELMKELESSKTSSVESAKKIEKKAMQREIIAGSKSYTPNGNGPILSDEAALLKAVTKVYEKASKMDYSLDFRAKIYIRADVDENGKARKVTFVKGPRAYLESENLCRGIANALGKYATLKEHKGKTIETNFSF